MRVAHFTTLTASGESETLEFKATTGTRREVGMAVCAFLNQGGRRIYEEWFKASLHKLMTGEIRVGQWDWNP